MRLLAIDPGVKHLGVAEFRAGRLAGCDLVQAGKRSIFEALHDFAEKLGPVDILAIEKPQVYRLSKGDPNDLIDVARVVGAAEYLWRASELREYRPHTWKGNAKKEAVEGWICKRLDSTETLRADRDMEYGRLNHNIWDAIGIGMYALGRLK